MGRNRHGGGGRVLAGCVVAAACASFAVGIRFYMEPRGEQCFSDTFEEGQRVMGDVVVTSARGVLEVDMVIKDEGGSVVWRKENIDHAKFEFTSAPAARRQHNRREFDRHQRDRRYNDYEHDDYMYDDEEDLWHAPKYEICLSSARGDVGAKKRRVTLNVHSGASARNYDELAKEEHLNELETTLRGMYDELTNLMQEVEHVRMREDALRLINESTNSRVVWYSAISCVVMLAVGAYQMLYMKNFFRKKKLHLF